MKTFLYTPIVVFLFFFSMNSKAQCTLETSICSQNTAGPFTFNSPGPAVSSCLDFFGPGYAYVILYITQSGPLEMLIDGNVSSGFLDVAIFDIPSGEDPCTAIQNNANQISCNYASSASGCNQIGNYFPCVSSVLSPQVLAGDKLMIVVENWSGASGDFTLQLAPAPAAQSGPGNPAILSPGFSVYESTPPFQMDAVDNGGLWSGLGISSNGVFDPSITGSGTFTVTYVLGTAPCDATHSYEVSVLSALAVEMKEIDLVCNEEEVHFIWETETQTNCDYFSVEKSRNGFDFEFIELIDGVGTTNEPQAYISVAQYDPQFPYYRLVETDLNGEKTVYGPFYSDCGESPFLVYPSPTDNIVNIEMDGFHLMKTTFDVYDAFGKCVYSQYAVIGNKQEISLQQLNSGVYTLIVRDEFHQKQTKIIKM